jgi:hypothetical protein
MFELAMTAFRPRKIPTVLFEKSDDILTFTRGIISCSRGAQEAESRSASGERYFITICGLFVTNRWRLS